MKKMQEGFRLLESKFAVFTRIFREEFWSWYLMLFNWVPGRIGAHLRGLLLGLFFGECGKNVLIKENIEIWKPRKLYVGNNSVIGRNNLLNCIGTIHIGNNVKMGPRVSIFTMNHTTINAGMVNLEKKIAPITIEDNVWVGANVVILPGVIIGKNSIIAAGCVVTKSFPENTVLAGVPAKNIKEKMTSVKR
jgi:maltose O-acetyltransferase